MFKKNKLIHLVAGAVIIGLLFGISGLTATHWHFWALITAICTWYSTKPAP